MKGEGLLLVLKPAEMTSHDVVDWVRDWSGLKRVGHTGTLDPTAEGLLPILMGRATRFSEYFLDTAKHYRAELTLGLQTDSGDACGKIIASEPVPVISAEKLKAAMSGFEGKQLQTPPMTSARRHGGRRLYELAHEGKSVQREPQEIIVHSLELLDFGTGAENRFPHGLLDVVCSSGTYVRTLCVDIGREVDSPAYMSYLLRCGVGPFHVNDAHTLEELEQLKPLGDSTPIIPLGQILQWFPTLKLDRKQAEGVIHGLPPEKVDRSAQLTCSRVSAGPIVSKSDGEAVEEVVRLVGPDDEFLAVGVLLQSNSHWTVDLKKVFP